MGTLSDAIEQYIRRLIRQTDDRILEIQRVTLADHFRCVPSQINYVLKTRFTPERGYIVQSRRGEGGYIRIIRVKSPMRRDLLLSIYRAAEEGVGKRQAIGYLERLREEKIITNREARIMAIGLGCGEGSVDNDLSPCQRGDMLKKLIELILSTGSGE